MSSLIGILSARPIGILSVAQHLTATLERLRVDRQLEEALTHRAYPLHLTLVFDIDEKTAIRYADSARALLAEAVEQASP